MHIKLKLYIFYSPYYLLGCYQMDSILFLPDFYWHFRVNNLSRHNLHALGILLGFLELNYWEELISKRSFEISTKAFHLQLFLSQPLHQHICIHSSSAEICHLFSQNNHVFYHQFHLGNERKLKSVDSMFWNLSSCKVLFNLSALNSNKACLKE